MRTKLPSLTTATLWMSLGAAGLAQAADTTLSVRPTPGQAGYGATAVVRSDIGSKYVLFARTDQVAERRIQLHVGTIGEGGRSEYEFELPTALVQSGASVTLQAIAIDPAGVRSISNEAGIGCSAIPYERFSMDYGMHSADVRRGEVLHEQWAEMGMHIHAINHISGPDKAIVFDTAMPTGGDFDLVTPGYGTGNNFAFENVMIVAENDIDANGDGYVDDPDDDANGGILFYDWDRPVLLSSVSLLDVDFSDPAGAVVRTYLKGIPVQDIFVPPLDDNNLQVIELDDLARVDELQVEFSGSGAVAEVDFLPCPILLTFDDSTTGIPFNRQTGEIVEHQWLSQGVAITGVTNDPMDPDAVLIFDTANPTGGDTDLVTPGYGVNNTIPRGQVLVLADDVIDLNGDGLVDDPGDSSGGGTFMIEFSVCVTLDSATVLDIDSAEPNCRFEAFDENGLSLGVFPLAQLGDNSIQTVQFGSIPRVRRLDLTLCASGALVDVVYCPTPELAGS